MTFHLIYVYVFHVDLNILPMGRSGMGRRILEETLKTSPAFPNDRPGIPRLFRFFLIILILIRFSIFVISAHLELPLILRKETPRDQDPSSLF